MTWRTVLLAIPLLLVAACSGGDAETSTVSPPVDVPATAVTATATPALPPPAPSPTATSTATPAPPAPSPAATATPAPPSAGTRAIFCEATDGDRVGFVRASACAGGENGFVTDDVGFAATVATGEFVPDCLQPAGVQGKSVIVGALCASFVGGAITVTDDPLPAELRGTFDDGDLVPWCGFDEDWAILTGPPCIQAGVGPARILLDVAVLEAQAACGAGLSLIAGLIDPYLELRNGLATLAALSPSGADTGTNFAAVHAALQASRDLIADAEPGEQAAAFFEPWGDFSPLVMNARTLALLDPLLAALASSDGTALAVDPAFVDHVNETLIWYAAGRGC